MAEGLSVIELLKGLDIPNFESEEVSGAAIVDAIIVLRYQKPEWDTPRLTYVKSNRMGDELTVGCLTNVLNHMKELILDGWT